MGVSLRLILFIIGIMIVTAIVLDGLRRVRQYYQTQNTSRKKQKDAPLFQTNDSAKYSDQHAGHHDPLIDEQTIDQLALDDNCAPVSAHNAQKKDRALDNDLIVLNVMAFDDKVFDGPNLLQAVLSMGLRHGQMAIFHCYDNKSPDKPVLFSLASAVEPGTFDLDNMGSLTTPGLSLFMSLPQCPRQPDRVFELMLHTARRLADRLGGQIMTADHTELTDAMVHAIEQHIQVFQQQWSNIVAHKKEPMPQ